MSGKNYGQQRSWSVLQTVLLKEAKTVTQTSPSQKKGSNTNVTSKMDISWFKFKLKVFCICGLSWLVLYSALRGFSSRNPLSLLTKKPHFDSIWLNSILYKSLTQITWRLYYNDVDYYDCGARGTCPCPGWTYTEDLGIKWEMCCLWHQTLYLSIGWGGGGLVRGSCWWNII